LSQRPSLYYAFVASHSSTPVHARANIEVLVLPLMRDWTYKWVTQQAMIVAMLPTR